MPINTRELLEAVAILTDERNMKANLKQSMKGAAICGASSLIGGIFLGPMGIAVGGIAGGITGALMTKDSFKPVGEIIRHDLSERQQQQLYDHLVTALREIDATDIALVIPFIMGNASVQQAMLRTTTSFITNELRMQIID